MMMDRTPDLSMSVGGGTLVDDKADVTITQKIPTATAFGATLDSKNKKVKKSSKKKESKKVDEGKKLKKKKTKKKTTAKTSRHASDHPSENDSATTREVWVRPLSSKDLASTNSTTPNSNDESSSCKKKKEETKDNKKINNSTSKKKSKQLKKKKKRNGDPSRVEIPTGSIEEESVISTSNDESLADLEQT